MQNFWFVFIPLFVAVDALGVLPIYLSLTQGLNDERRYKVILQSVFTASITAAIFLTAGETVLNFLNITIPDFMIAGGILLFVLSMANLLGFDQIQKKTDLDSLGAVPIGVPLIVGPAVLTTSLLLIRSYGVGLTSLALFLNILIAGLVFSFARVFNKLLGNSGSRTLSKLAHLLLAAIAVMIVRRGVFLLITNINH